MGQRERSTGWREELTKLSSPFLWFIVLTIPYQALHLGEPYGLSESVWGSYRFILLAASLGILLFGASLATLVLALRFLRAPLWLERTVLALVLGMYVSCFVWIQGDYFINSLVATQEVTSLVKIVSLKKMAVLMLGLFIPFALTFRKVRREYRPLSNRSLVPLVSAALLLVVTALVIKSPVDTLFERPAQNSYDIVIMSFDSVQLSEWDLDRPETSKNFPFLSSKKDELMYGTSFYPNAVATHGAMAALYSGISADKTKVIQTPGRLKGAAAEKNLAAILKKAGYKTHSSITQKWGNPKFIGIGGAFDSINGEPVSYLDSFDYQEDWEVIPEVVRTMNRVRYEYAARLQKLANPRQPISVFADTSDRNKQKVGDEEKQRYLLDLLRSPRVDPLFVHIHYMTLHGYEKAQIASIQPVLNVFDDYIREAYEALRDQGRLDRTILVVLSDHGMDHSLTRVPLMIRFPEQKHSGPLAIPSQISDITPTLLDALGSHADLQHYTGNSLLRPDRIDKHREIIVAAEVSSDEEDSWRAPNFQIGKFMILQDGRERQVNAEQFRMNEKGEFTF